MLTYPKLQKLPIMAQAGRESGGDIFDMAEKGTSVPETAAEPRHIKSVPRPGEGADADDPNQLGGTTLADAATNATDIPRVGQRDVDGELKLTITEHQRYGRCPNSDWYRRRSPWSSRLEETARCARWRYSRPERQRKHKVYRAHCPAE